MANLMKQYGKQFFAYAPLVGCFKQTSFHQLSPSFLVFAILQTYVNNKNHKHKPTKNYSIKSMQNYAQKILTINQTRYLKQSIVPYGKSINITAKHKSNNIAKGFFHMHLFPLASKTHLLTNFPKQKQEKYYHTFLLHFQPFALSENTK